VGVDAVAHVIATALEADPLAVACAVDCENAFNPGSRAAVFAAVQSRMPQLLPVQWAYGTASPLHVAGAPPGTEPILSRCGVRQGDPLAPPAVRARDANGKTQQSQLILHVFEMTYLIPFF
jgi:hypothetical protein